MKTLPARLLTAAALAMAAAGCGQATSSSSAPPATAHDLPTGFAAAAASTRQAGSATVELSMNLPTPEGTVEVRGSGQFDFRHRRGNLHMTMMTSTAVTIAVDEIMDGTTLYMKMPLLTSQLPQGKQWLKMDLSSIGKSAGVDLGSLMQGNQDDPGQMLSYLEATSDHVQELGTATVGGVQTTHYRGTVDLRKVVAQAPAGARAGMRKLMQTVTASLGTSTYPVDVWIDSSGLVRQISEHLPQVSSSSEATFTMRFSKFGAPVRVTAPPASQTVDLQTLAKLGRPS